MEALPSPLQLDLFVEPAPEASTIDAERRKLQARYDALAVTHGLPPARVVLSGRRATGGVIQYGPPHTIRISFHMSAEDRLQTLLHEAAHAICHARWGAEEGHSRRFWTIARRLGVERKSAPETERLRTIRALNARYSYRCPGCTAEWTRKKPFGRARLCAACERKGRPARLILVRRPRPRRRSR
ncbi:MAG TPA: SprT-like domain-containing protein [Thermoanaerobaculia bacterium]|nr:SprT-like domain-containing protein [Thermoanaerobaculia bacterium]